MPIYKCLNCNYQGKKFIYTFNNYGYCIATNKEEPEYLNDAPDWVKAKGSGDAEIGEPVGCPKCHIFSVDNFEKI